MTILVLGGTREAMRLTRALVAADVDTVYSLAGRTVEPADPPCPVRSGGFGGPDGLTAYMRSTGVRVLVDATHPFAAGMRSNAQAAAQALDRPLIRLARSPWQPQPGDRWRRFETVSTLRAAVTGYRRPFITLGQSAADWRPAPGQQFTLRAINRPKPASSVSAPADAPRTTWEFARGPFTLDDERQALAGHDALVCKHSGGHRPAKLDVTRERALPVLMLQAPVDEPADAYTTVEAALAAVLDILGA